MATTGRQQESKQGGAGRAHGNATLMRRAGRIAMHSRTSTHPPSARLQPSVAECGEATTSARWRGGPSSQPWAHCEPSRFLVNKTRTVLRPPLYGWEPAPRYQRVHVCTGLHCCALARMRHLHSDVQHRISAQCHALSLFITTSLSCPVLSCPHHTRLRYHLSAP
jgi:hypothetical protein